MTAMKGIAVVWGAHKPRPIVNIPIDALKVRLRLRNDDMGRAFVKFKDRIEHWILVPIGPGVSGDWMLGFLQGVNRISA